MKKYTILFILLAGCVKTYPYRCMDANVDKQTISEKATVFCVANTDVDYMKKENYDTKKILEFGNYAVQDLYKDKCFFGKNSTDYSNPGHYVYGNGNRVSDDARVYACLAGSVNKYEQSEQERIEQEKYAKERAAELKKIENKIGKKLCSFDNLPENPHYNTDGVPTLEYMGNSALKGCAFQLGWSFAALNQTSSGTLITVQSAYSHVYENNIYLISKNTRDSKLVDNQRVADGLFENIGTFQYTTPMGVKKTVLKLKRLSGPEIVEQIEEL